MLMRLAVLFGALVAVSLGPPCPAADSWRAGVAKAKITPAAPMWMAGYGSRNHPATGLLNDLWARALVLEDPRGTRVAIVALDLVGIGLDVAQPLGASLASKYGLERSHVAWCCSHTHSGPAIGHNLHVL
ncbi:MAG TPA: neutral/alkaline non-lysosomal ceramidase N-terminal domain-containing protein, partial [Pirellulales bacterium]|nr:neutral/alkaline non-lysosomal ceramidase N-terminal domain-containing protein [Pirellulales bacterium]